MDAKCHFRRKLTDIVVTCTGKQVSSQKQKPSFHWNLQSMFDPTFMWGFYIRSCCPFLILPSANRWGWEKFPRLFSPPQSGWSIPLVEETHSCGTGASCGWSPSSSHEFLSGIMRRLSAAGSRIHGDPEASLGVTGLFGPLVSACLAGSVQPH